MNTLLLYMNTLLWVCKSKTNVWPDTEMSVCVRRCEKESVKRMCSTCICICKWERKGNRNVPDTQRSVCMKERESGGGEKIERVYRLRNLGVLAQWLASWFSRLSVNVVSSIIMGAFLFCDFLLVELRQIDSP